MATLPRTLSGLRGVAERDRTFDHESRESMKSHYCTGEGPIKGKQRPKKWGKMQRVCKGIIIK